MERREGDMYKIHDINFFFSSKRRHNRSCKVSWARRSVLETAQILTCCLLYICSLKTLTKLLINKVNQPKRGVSEKKEIRKQKKK